MIENEFFNNLIINFNYLMCMILILVGLYAMVVEKNLIKKIMGLNIFSTAVLLFMVTISYKEGGAPPILVPGVYEYANPLPQALVLTGIVVGVALTATGFALIIKIHEKYGTIDDDVLKMLME
jgi:multicomponent Na+:H+ antiporter subunit C